jgi:hypothetical protein
MYIKVGIDNGTACTVSTTSKTHEGSNKQAATVTFCSDPYDRMTGIT